MLNKQYVFLNLLSSSINYSTYIKDSRCMFIFEFDTKLVHYTYIDYNLDLIVDHGTFYPDYPDT